MSCMHLSCAVILLSFPTKGSVSMYAYTLSFLLEAFKQKWLVDMRIDCDCVALFIPHVNKDSGNLALLLQSWYNLPKYCKVHKSSVPALDPLPWQDGPLQTVLMAEVRVVVLGSPKWAQLHEICVDGWRLLLMCVVHESQLHFKNIFIVICEEISAWNDPVLVCCWDRPQTRLHFFWFGDLKTTFYVENGLVHLVFFNILFLNFLLKFNNHTF